MNFTLKFLVFLILNDALSEGLALRRVRHERVPADRVEFALRLRAGGRVAGLVRQQGNVPEEVAW